MRSRQKTATNGVSCHLVMDLATEACKKAEQRGSPRADLYCKRQGCSAKMWLHNLTHLLRQAPAPQNLVMHRGQYMSSMPSSCSGLEQ